jgi:nicotinate-nucleotide adenylyltransferase
VIGLFGGAFDPPHDGHVALVARARAVLGLDEVVVIVAAAPGHKEVRTDASLRLRLAEAAFPGETVVLDDHARTIDMLRAHPEWAGAVFLLGADQFAAFPEWKEPEGVLDLVSLGVATRPGFLRESLDRVLARLDHPDRVTFFELDPLPIASTELRERLMRGEDVSALVPSAVRAVIERDGLYGRGGYTGDA